MVTGTGSSSTVARVDGENNDYSGDFTKSCGLIYMKDAAGVVEELAPLFRPLVLT